MIARAFVVHFAVYPFARIIKAVGIIVLIVRFFHIRRTTENVVVVMIWSELCNRYPMYHTMISVINNVRINLNVICTNKGTRRIHMVHCSRSIVHITIVDIDEWNRQY